LFPSTGHALLAPALAFENALAAAAAACATDDGFSPAAEDVNSSGTTAESPLVLMTGGDRERVRPPRRLIVVVRGADAAPGTDAVDGGRLVVIAIGIVLSVLLLACDSFVSSVSKGCC
jgi:hypothetical protein